MMSMSSLGFLRDSIPTCGSGALFLYGYLHCAALVLFEIYNTKTRKQGVMSAVPYVTIYYSCFEGDGGR